MLKSLGIDPAVKMRTLSKGTKEKVQLILVMSRNASLYILDEPIAGVDPAARDYILRTIINNYNPEANVLISTHLIEDVEQVLDEVIFMRYGQLVLYTSVDNIRDTISASARRCALPILVGDMMAFIQYTMQIIMGFLMLCMISIMLPRAAVAADRVEEVLKSETMIHDPKQEKHFPEDGKGVLTFDHVSFRYPGADEDVLEDITFTAKPGETTAIIGSTGSGKSTLVNLIPRFYDVTSGDITLDGVDIREVKQHELREKLGYVPQKGVLFSGDIASNIMFGNSHGSDDEMIEAAEIAQATEFIDTKPEKYKSPISQGGSNVSGGQKQRLSIARAIAKHPQVFIFDDSFSALDYKTDVTLRRALAEKTSGSTVLIVAQRISTILHAEQIIVLDEGKVAGKGTHAELLKNCPVYREIAESQLSRKELEAALNEQTDGKEDQIHG